MQRKNRTARLSRSPRAMRRKPTAGFEKPARLPIRSLVFWEMTTRLQELSKHLRSSIQPPRLALISTGCKSKRESLNRYFKSDSETTVNDSVNTPMFTFVDGDCTLMSGSGFLVVTGTLTMRGNTNFKGSILVLGKGVLIRNGGGNGDILGGITIAAFGRTAGGFTAPTF